MPRTELRSSRRRPAGVRLVLGFALLLLLIASSLLLQARWLRQLTEAQRGEARRLLGVAAERMAEDVEAELTRFAESLAPGSHASAEETQRTADWAAEILPLEPGVDPSLVEGPSLHVGGEEPGAPERLVVLDLDRLRAGLFEPRARVAFGDDAFASLRVTIVATKADGALLYDSAREPVPAGPPEATAELHLETSRWTSFFSLEPGGGFSSRPVQAPLFVSLPGGAEPDRIEPPPAPYRIEVRHRDGSLDEALAQAQRRNLWIGAGILLALVGSAILLWVGEQRARRLTEKELAFVAGVSHELRTPLAVIRTAASNLRTGVVGADERVREYGALIEREATRVGESVERVLRFGADEEDGPRERIELTELVQEAVQRVELLRDRRRFSIEADVPAGKTVLADRAALVSALLNLLENAVKYGPDGQTIRLRARTVDGEHRLEVTDEGPGLAPGERERVFEPFFRGSAARGGDVVGSGLGLALVARIARAHGGRVEVGEVRSGGGAVFTLSLPRAEGDAA